jgi:Na+/serine symporter
MKKFFVLLASILLVASLSACASSGLSGGSKVKCPACGHEFTAQDTGK